MLKTAIEYVSYGFSVFPTNGKIPATKNGFKDATKDLEKLKQFFNNTCNIAIATGKVSGIFVIDIDNKNGVSGSDSLRELEREFGTLPHTVEVLTPSGGRHLYFKYVDGIGCRTALCKGIDIRGDGGYVVAPPSEIDGKHYEWEVTSLPSETQIADAPKWLIDLLAKKEVHQTIDDIVTQGGRNDHLMKVAVSLRKQGVSPDQLESVLQSINKTKCNPPLDPKEVTQIATSIGKYDSNVKETIHYTDMWNAHLFVKMHGESIRYCNSLGGWLVWNGLIWSPDETFQIMRFAQETVREIHRMASISGDTDLFKHAIKSEAEARMNAMVSLARYGESITLSSDAFDANDFLVTVLNGTIDLRTGKLSKHTREDYITQLCRANYDTGAQCPRWELFLKEVLGDDELIKFVQKAIGYSLSGSTKEQCLFMLYGTGRNGKSTFLNTILRIMGDYAKNTPSSILLEKRNESIPNDVARLRGARFVTSTETDKGRNLAEAHIKQLTGGDIITARFLHKEFFQFKPKFKIFFATNHKPTVSGVDIGIWRRMIPIPFEREIKADEIDKDLDSTLIRETDGILRWAVNGFLKWQEDGFTKPRKVYDFTTEYQQESDLIRNYIEENCEFGDYEVLASVIQSDLKQWCRNNSVRTVKRNEFNEWMKRNGFEKILSSKLESKNCYVFKSLRVKNFSTSILYQPPENGFKNVY